MKGKYFYHEVSRFPVYFQEADLVLVACSYFSPLMKSITNRGQTDYAMIEEDLEERDDFISTLESRFLYLAADARSTLRF